MAGKDKKEKAAKDPGKRAGKTLMIGILVMSAVFSQFSLVFIVCMIPSMVAAVVDRQPQKTAWVTVGAMNLAGTIPAWFALIAAGSRLSDAFQIIMRPDVIIIAYGAAGIGWVIYNNVTPLVAGIVVSRNEKRLKDIEKRRAELVRKWGEEVVTRS